MVADKVTKMDAKMVIKSIFREQNVQLELVAGGCADDNVISRLVGLGGGPLQKLASMFSWADFESLAHASSEY